MLRVRSLGTSGRIASGFSTGVAPWADAFSVYTLVPYPVSSNTITIDGRISTGEADARGDRQCAHIKVDGDLFSTGGSVITETTAPVAVSPSYSLISGSLPTTIGRWLVKRSNGTTTTLIGSATLLGCSGSARILDNVVYALRTKPLTWYEFEYLDIGVRAAGAIHTYYKSSKYRTTKNGGVTWTGWTTTDETVVVNEYDVSTDPPRYRTYTGSLPGAWSSLRTTIAPCSDVPNYQRTLTEEEARALDGWVAAATPSQRTDIWGDLCMEALQDAKSLDINTGMYLYELATIGSSVKSTISLLKGKITPKTLAKLYLTDRYGVRLTVADTKSIIDAASRELRQTTKNYSWVRSVLAESMIAPKGRFTGCSASVTYHYKVYYQPYDHWFANSLRTLMDIDLFPTLTNVWDFVPFSFVADWFIDIGSLFERIDMRTYASTLWVLGTLSSTKRVVSGIPGSRLPFGLSGISGLAGSWTCTSYQRTRSSSLVLPRLILDTPREFSNYAELAAIIATKL